MTVYIVYIFILFFVDIMTKGINVASETALIPSGVKVR